MRYLLASALIFGLGATFSSPAHAQSAPAECKPNAGATYECTSELKTPWVYLNASCGAPQYSGDESAAEGLWDAEYAASLTACPGGNLSRVGWIGAAAPMCVGGYCGPSFPSVSTACGGGPSLYPAISGSGLEIGNWLVYQVSGNQNPPACNPVISYFIGKVRRDRPIACERAFSWGGNYCWRTGQVNPAKSTGPARCPVGNPISPGTGNKCQTEVDYVGGGDYPLTFARKYNSQQRIADRDQGHFGFTDYFDRYGNEAWYKISTSQGKIGLTYGAGQDRRDALRWTNLALDSVGANWRHNYQRSIHYNASSPGGISSAVAYRHDGRALTFIHHAGAFHPDADITDRLTGSPTTSWTYTDGETQEVETYNVDGRLQSIRSRSGLTHMLAYDTDGRLLTVTDDFGKVLTFTYAHPAGNANAVHRITGFTTPGGLTYQYGFGANATLTTVTYPDNKTKQYEYNGPTPRALTAIIDENANTFATWGYDAYGQATSSSHAGGAGAVSVAYGKSGDTQIGPATVTDTLGVVRTYNFTSILGVPRPTNISQVDPVNGTVTQTMQYDSNGNVTRRKDFKDQISCYAYDTARNLETVRVEGFAASISTCPANLSAYTPTPGTRERKIVTAWHATFRTPTSITEANRTTSFTYFASGNVQTRTVTDTSVTPNVTRTWTYTYNEFGKVLTEDGPRTDVTDLTTWTYYTCTTGAQCGQVNTVTNALSHVTTYNSYNAHGQPTQITNANGLVTTLGYDVRQRLTQRCAGSTLPTCTGGELTTMEYWPTGLLKKVTSPDASFIQYTYDNAHRLTEIADGAGNRIVYSLDAAGNRTAENTFDPSSNLKRTHSQVFNSLNQLWKDVNAAGTAAVTTTFGYDANGNQTTTSAPLSRSSTNAYDELNRLNQITDPNSGITAFGYDANDNLTSVTDPRSLVTSYTYTGFGDLKTQVSPDTGTTTNTYDSGGNLKTSTDARSAITTYTYDALNRVKTAAYKIGSTTDQTITYTYDGGTNQKGHLTGASDSTHVMAWAYDTKGRVTGKTQTYIGVTPNVPITIGYGYNVLGQLASLVMPSGQTISYGYNANNQVTSVTLLGSPNVTILSNITYDPFGPITGWTWGTSQTTSRTFDTDGKLTAINNSIAAVGNRSFGFDDAFRITSSTDSATGGPAWTLGYDILDRLNSASKTATTIGYTYDANGNRLTQTGTSPSTHTVSTTSNRLSSVSGALTRSYLYDLAGNTTQSGATIHSYNNRGRMKTGRLSATGTNTNYVYNALGQRMRKSGGTPGTVYFAYDEAGHLVGEYTWSGTALVLQQETIWLGDIPVATIRPKTGGVDVFYVHTDQLNTPRKITVSAGVDVNKLRWKWDPNPFGDGAPNENPAVPALGIFKYNLRFQGQQFDVETNLNYNYFRDYDSAIGRYVESDPIGIDGGINTFVYAENDPIRHLDPFGLHAIPWIGPRIGPITRPGTSTIDPVLPWVLPQDRTPEEIAECEKECGETWSKHMTTCEVMWKMKGRPKSGYVLCKQRATKIYIECIADCSPTLASCPQPSSRPPIRVSQNE